MKTKHYPLSALHVKRVAPLMAFLAMLLSAPEQADAEAPCGNKDPNGPPKCPAPGINYFNPSNGNPARQITDLTVWGTIGDYPLSWTRHASARMNTGPKWFGQGQNWRHSYQYELVQSGSSLDLYLPDGNILRYANYSGYWWQGLPGTEWLAQTGDNAWLHGQDGSVRHFRRHPGSPAYWLLVDITDPSGNVTTLTYDESRRLVQVTEPAGRWLRISYAGIPVNQSQFAVLGSIAGRPAGGAWTEITVGDNTAYRYLRYYSTNTGSVESYGNVAEIEFYDKAGNRLSGAAFGNGPAWGNGANTYHKASDGNVNTFYDYAYPHFGFAGIDLGAGNEKAIGKIRFYPRAGFEGRMNVGWNSFGLTGCRFEGSNAAPLSLSAIAKVESSDGRAVEYDYTTMDDPALPQSWLVLSGARYGDGTAAAYRYTQVFAGQPPLMSEANDPRYSGAGRHIKYAYWNSGIYGQIYQELNGATGSVLVTLDGAGGSSVVTYPNGHVETYTAGDAIKGRITQRTDTLGRTSRFTYGGHNNGFLASETDPLGRTTSFTYDQGGMMLSRTHPDGSVERWTRNNPGYELSHTDELGRKTTTTRDARQRPTRIDYPDASYETFAYNPFGQVLTHRLRNGGSESFAYDERGLKTSHTDALGSVTTYTYDVHDRLASVSSGGHTTGYVYNERGLLMQIIHPDGSTVSHTYDAYGNRLTETNELGNTWARSYDEFNRVVTVTNPLNQTTTYSYALGAAVCGSCHSDDKPTQITLPSGKITKIAYDVAGRKISETVGLGSADAATTTYAYDAANNPVTVTDPRGKTWSTAYDNRNRPTSAADPLGNTTQWTYDAAGNKLTEKRPDNGVTTNTYDVMNRLVSTTDPKSQTTTFAYGGTGAGGTKGDNLVALTDAKGNSYTFTYDLRNRKTRMGYPDGSHEDWAYDAGGQIATYTTRASQVQTFSHDTRERETGYTWSDGTPSVTKAYDAAGRLLQLHSSVSQIAYTYDAANRLMSETSTVANDGAPKTVSYTYDADGNKASVTYPSGSVITYTYTARNQMASITADAPPPIATYTYDLNGNRTLKTLENGTNAIYSYDTANRMLGIDHRKGTGPLVQVGYTYNAVSNRLSKSTALGGASAVTETYGYDPTDQVTSVEYGTGRTTAFNYDAVGNRTTVADSAGLTPATYTVDAGNRYTSIDGRTVSNDSNGNLNGVTYTSGGPAWTYTYDAQNRLLSASATGTAVTFAYDGRNRCVKRTVNGTATFLIYDGWSLIEERTGTDAELRRYIHGPVIDEIIATIDTTGSHFYHHDALGSTVALTDSDGAIKESYTYDVYGAATIFGAAGTAISDSAVGNRFLFTGREWLSEIVLYEYRNRALSPHTGRFLQTDPVGFDADDVNIYRYANNGPSNRTDPYGLIADAGDIWKAGGVIRKSYGTFTGVQSVGVGAGIGAAVGRTISPMLGILKLGYGGSYGAEGSAYAAILAVARHNEQIRNFDPFDPGPQPSPNGPVPDPEPNSSPDPGPFDPPPGGPPTCPCGYNLVTRTNRSQNYRPGVVHPKGAPGAGIKYYCTDDQGGIIIP